MIVTLLRSTRQRCGIHRNERVLRGQHSKQGQHLAKALARRSTAGCWPRPRSLCSRTRLPSPLRRAVRRSDGRCIAVGRVRSARTSNSPSGGSSLVARPSHCASPRAARGHLQRAYVAACRRSQSCRTARLSRADGSPSSLVPWFETSRDGTGLCGRLWELGWTAPLSRCWCWLTAT